MNSKIEINEFYRLDVVIFYNYKRHLFKIQILFLEKS